jgi:hypothetical protein
MEALGAALSACATQLTSLKLMLSVSSEHPCWDVSAVVAAMPRLQSLAVASNSSLQVGLSLARLTALKSLELYPANQPQLEVYAALPPTLTSLRLRATAKRNGQEAALPSQVNVVPAPCLSRSAFTKCHHGDGCPWLFLPHFLLALARTVCVQVAVMTRLQRLMQAAPLMATGPCSSSAALRRCA